MTTIGREIKNVKQLPVYIQENLNGFGDMIALAIEKHNLNKNERQNNTHRQDWLRASEQNQEA